MRDVRAMLQTATIASFVIGAIILGTVGVVVLDDRHTEWLRQRAEITAPVDPTVSVDKANKVIRVDINSIPQDYLVCLAAACKLPAEWRQPTVPVFGPGPGVLDVVTPVGMVRRFTVSTIDGTAGVVFMPTGER